MGAILDFSAPLPAASQSRSVRSPLDTKLFSATEQLAAAACRLADFASRIAHNDLVLSNGVTLNSELIAAHCELFERRILAFREAAADVAGVPASNVVEYADEFSDEMQAACATLVKQAGAPAA